MNARARFGGWPWQPLLSSLLLVSLAGTAPACTCGSRFGTDGGVGADTGTPGVDSGAVAYIEDVCEPLADLSDLQAGYVPTIAGLRSTLEEISLRRYPIASLFIDANSDSNLMTWYSFSGFGTFTDALDGYEVAVHEGAHIWDFSNSPPGMHSYRVREDLVINTLNLTNFARSEILTIHGFAATDFYAQTYLMGASGSQGFNNLLDEYNAYAHSLASKYCTRDSLQPGWSITSRDGILTFMYYVESYLKLARTNHPADYAAIIADPGHIQLILTVWDRAEFWLGITAGNPELGIDDDMIAPFVYDTDNLMEIDLLRE